MTEESKTTKKNNKPVAFITGICLLIAGITAILSWWPDVIIFVKGFTGMALAISGLLILYFLTKL